VIAKTRQQLGKFVGAAVHVADDVEGADQAALVGPERSSCQCGGVDRGSARQVRHLTETLPLQPTQATTDLADHALRDGGAELAVGAELVALVAGVDIDVEHDGHGQRMPAARNLDPLLALGGAHIGSVDDARATKLKENNVLYNIRDGF
jgi:hypothetical protein